MKKRKKCFILIGIILFLIILALVLFFLNKQSTNQKALATTKSLVTLQR